MPKSKEYRLYYKYETCPEEVVETSTDYQEILRLGKEYQASTRGMGVRLRIGYKWVQANA